MDIDVIAPPSGRGPGLLLLDGSRAALS